MNNGWRSLRVLLLALVLGVMLMLVMASPATASLHTYHEQPGQTTFRSRQTVRDRNNIAWQVTVFKRYGQGTQQGTYLRLVGFPGQGVVDRQADLQVQTGTVAQWAAPHSVDLLTKSLPENVAQYDFKEVLAQLQQPIPLTLVVPLVSAAPAQLVVAPYVVDEWLQLYRLQE